MQIRSDATSCNTNYEIHAGEYVVTLVTDQVTGVTDQVTDQVTGITDRHRGLVGEKKKERQNTSIASGQVAIKSNATLCKTSC